MSFGFPSNPSNKKQYVTTDGKAYQYDSTRGAWAVGIRSATSANTINITDVSQLADPSNLLDNPSSTLPVYASEESLYASTADLDVGQMAYVSENGKIAIWNGSSWFGATTIEYVPFVAGTYYGDRAVVAGGSSQGQHYEIDYFDLTTAGNAIDFGDIVFGRSSNHLAGASDGTYAAYSGKTTNLDYVTISTPANATNIGALRTECERHLSIGDGTYGYVMAGNPGGTFNYDIDRWTMATTGTATDVGDLTNPPVFGGIWGNGDRTVITGGSDANGYLDIDYISLQNLSSGASTFGNLTVQRRYSETTGDSTRAVIGGGRKSDNVPIDTIDYVTIETPGNAANFGNLTQTMIQHTATSNLTYGAWTAGNVGGGAGGGGSYNAQIDILTIQTTGTATDHGDLTVARESVGSASGSPS
jgi:hypothetical protein